MGFHDVRINDVVEVDFGSRGAPNFSVLIVENDAGQEEAVARWEAPKREYEANFGRRRQYRIYDLIEFYIARQGPTHSFRFKDWSDYATTSNGTVHLPDSSGSLPVVSALDVTIGSGNGSQTTFQLYKEYTSGAVTRTRTIKLPVQGTVKVAIDGVVKTEGTHFSVNYTTGVITFGTAPGSGLDVTAGCQFDVEVRFDQDTNLDVTKDSFATESTQVVLREVRDQTPNPEEAFHGGAKEWGTFSVDFDITLAHGRLHTFAASTSGLSITLPPETDVEPGGPIFYLSNEGADDVDLLRDDTSLLVTIPAGQIVVVLLSDDGAGTRNWLASRV